MYMVRGWPTGADGPDEARAMRAPHEPQKAKLACTVFPQVGHGISPAGAGPPTGGDGRGVTVGAATVLAKPAPNIAPTVEPGAVRPGGPARSAGAGGAASGLGGIWNEPGAANGVGILGESFQGMPLFGRAAAGGVTDRSSPAAAALPMLPPPPGGGGRTVRAVSRFSPSSTGGSGASVGGDIVGGDIDEGASVGGDIDGGASVGGDIVGGDIDGGDIGRGAGVGGGVTGAATDA
jgi:hypothetical protein